MIHVRHNFYETILTNTKPQTDNGGRHKCPKT